MCTAIGLFCFVSQAAAGIKTATTTKLSLSSTSIVYGNEESATFSSEVTADAGTPTGEVEFKAGKTKVCIGTLTNGLTNCSPSKQTLLKIGTYPVVAEYKGAKTYAKSTSGATDLTVEAEGSAPVATITKAPSGEVPSGQVEVDFSSSQADSSFECSLDGSTYASCSSPDVFTVAAGRHTFSVVAVNSTGVRSKAPATASWTAIGTAAVLDVCGKVAGNETWSPEIAKVYVLTCEAEVPAGAILSISAGTIIKADSGTGLEVNGVLSAAGTSSSPVTFTSINDDSVGGDTNGNPESTPSAGEWRGISVSVGSNATSRPSVSLEHTTVSYYSSVETREASSVSVANSRFVRGPGTTCCGYGSASVSAVGPISVTGDSFIGVAHKTTGYYSGGLSVSQNGSGGSATTTVSGNAVENMDSTAVTVSSNGPITVQNNKVVGGTGDAFQLYSLALNPASITGNTSSGDLQNALGVDGTLAASWALPYSGLPVVVNSRLTVPEGITLSLAAGTVLKFEDDGLLEVNGVLSAAGTSSSPVTFTSINDDSVGGDTNGNPESTPSAGEWRGISVSVGSNATSRPSVSLEHTTVSYYSSVETREASSVSVANSRFVRGPGTTCCGYGSASVSAVGPISVTGDSFIGVAHKTTGYYSGGLSVSQNGSGGSATTTVSGNAVENMDSTAVTVSSNGPITVQNNKVVGGTGDAFQLYSLALNPASITGNTSSGDLQNALGVDGTLAASWALPYSGLPVVVNSRLTVPEGITLSLAAGTVLKFEDDGLLEVNGVLSAAGTSSSPVTFTSINDDSVGGDTNGNPESTPSAGEWRGISVSVGSNATSRPSVSLEHTTVSYYSSVETREASSVSVANSRFVRGPGTTCCGYGSASVSAVGPISVTGDSFIGVAHKTTGYYSGGLSVSQNGSGGSATTTVSGNAVENMDSTAVTVSSNGPITVQNNKVVGGTGDAFQLYSLALNPASITGNTSSGDLQNALGVDGTLAASWALPYSGLPVVVNSRLTVPEGITLSLAAGTVLKFEDDGLLEVNGVLSAAGTSSSPVTFTSINDDSVGGDTNGNPESTPSAGEWRGISINTGFGAVNPPTVNLAETTLRYAQTAISASGEANVTVHGTIDDDNFGVSASTRSPVNATDVYWGSSSGPAPYGSGVGVSEGVLVTPWLTS
jgi:hypothetical protein